ncbi:16S rRNA (cytidine(1402)-2'-O)-methyltransferase [Anoxybacter fermentans]|uniref:Ribosomal RNA small subunit methyltransferase I n=1 Tax=Anoxybacter fermentans TaxID=1323375 RepID=A0A3Q9HS03_9FIRM|nr:16S rRNA (cytidine(1402)-2'-O)-methyltransferase [Anoxybacter fermentans]
MEREVGVLNGKLYLVGTPIGNLEDITYRAVRILREVDLIAAEDTRHTRKLLEYFDIKTPTTSYHEHNEIKKGPQLIEKILKGSSIALVTDAGMPGISDPGYRLVLMAWEANVEVIPIPGPTALITALVTSGLETDRFTFEGFLPRKKNQRKKKLQELIKEPRTMVFYEAPHRLIETLEDLKEVMGESRMVMVARELTKKHEEKVRGTVKEVLAKFKQDSPKGEIVLVVAGSNLAELKEETMGWEGMSVLEHLKVLMDAGLTKKQAIKKVACERNLPKSEVYQIAIKIDVNEFKK